MTLPAAWSGAVSNVIWLVLDLGKNGSLNIIVLTH